MPRQKKESNSRPARWARACLGLRLAVEAAQTFQEAHTPEGGEFDKEQGLSPDDLEEYEGLLGTVEDEVNMLEELRSEYEEWRDNLPEGLQSSPLGDKLQDVCDLDTQWDTDDDLTTALDIADNCEGADLPLGFGRD